ncbi:MAG TPA: flagellin [Marinospirillum sp.]|uniref:flagellin N-terminal helical domain-containing protein n=1 Tax=Marinospirillum sp. TaxID=2183934 RepID=UPI002B4783F5|nr:flagellin [Marinospirillum sp.]HKM16049.1 flagellin [Marinospirillum sp.]
MAMVLNTNIASMNAQRNLSTTQAQQATTFQRLSTGLRINSAKDDAAGLYLAQSQTKDIRGLNMATRNASDGISMAQTAEGALDQVGQNLQRINELAIQSANGTYNDAAREGLQKEVDQLTQEINRIVETTEFNGKKLLSPEATATTLQIGFRDDLGSRIETGLEGGLVAQGDTNIFTFEGAGKNFATQGQANAAGYLALAQNLLKDDVHPNTVLDSSTGATYATDITLGTLTGNTGDKIKEELQQLGNGQSVTVDGMTFTRQASNPLDKVGTELEISFDGKTTTVNAAWDASDGKYTPTAKISSENMTDLFGGAVAATAPGSKPNSENQPLAAEFFGAAGTTVFAAIDINNMKIAPKLEALLAGEKVELDGITYARGSGTSASDLNITYKANTIKMPGIFSTDTEIPGIKATAPTTLGMTTIQSKELFGEASTKLNNMSTLLDGDLSGTKVIDISNPESARKAIDFTRESIDIISEIRATFGAVMNRFEAVISGNQTYGENLSAARSRIQDADFATETANLAKQQVLQQAGVASLSQANASSQAILSLLG